jgi:hypothetical protein
MDELMHIDKYKIYNMHHQWKDGKKKKQQIVGQYVTSGDYTCMRPRDFISMISELYHSWNIDSEKEVEIEVTFKDHKEY